VPNRRFHRFPFFLPLFYESAPNLAFQTIFSLMQINPAVFAPAATHIIFQLTKLTR